MYNLEKSFDFVWIPPHKYILFFMWLVFESPSGIFTLVFLDEVYAPALTAAQELRLDLQATRVFSWREKNMLVKFPGQRKNVIRRFENKIETEACLIVIISID